MAFNWQTFRTRTLTGAVFIAVMLTGLLWNQWSFLALFTLIHFGCWWEYLNLTEKIHQTTFHPYIKTGLMVMGYGLVLWFCGEAFEINGYGLKQNLSLPVSTAGFTLLLIGIFQKAPIKLNAFVAAFIGLLYISLSWGLMMDLYSFTEVHVHDTMYILANHAIPVIIAGSIWLNDTMAYLVGSLIGKTSLSKISPKKTWEGTIGGIILCIAIISFAVPPIFFPFAGRNFLFLFAIIATIISVTGTFGDLLESKLKRMADVKDSGSLMPGHGGFLDRFDSLLIATPFVWLFLNIFMR